jgi:uncharacterized protein YodC (DUF2158 family)
MSEDKIVYKVGDLVQLRCGGPAMIVLDPEYPGEGFYKGKAHVTWFNGNHREQYYFDHQVICPYGTAIEYVNPHYAKKAEVKFKKSFDKEPAPAKANLNGDVLPGGDKLKWSPDLTFKVTKNQDPEKTAPVMVGAMTTCSKHGIAHQISKGCHYCCED